MKRLRLTVVGTFFERYENSLPLLKRLYVDSTRKPDEALLMCETSMDSEALDRAYETLYDLELLDGWPDGLKIIHCPTPRREGGRYEVIPYANKINHALGVCTGDAVVYLDNGSDPKPGKYQAMIEGLEVNPEWGATYCTQKRTGMHEMISEAAIPIEDAFCNLNYTQVCHRLTGDRWPLDMALANPDLADGHFWRSLHVTLGAFYPVGGPEVLDEHHIPGASAVGVS